MSVAKMPYRPNPLSTLATYTSWSSLTDKTFSARHLPASDVLADLPSVETVANLFMRQEGQFIPSPKSTVLFSYFAQWFTDGFLRSDRPTPPNPPDPRKNDSNNDIDLMQIYGLKADVTEQLRSHVGGLLKSQLINGEEYPPYLCDENGVPKQEFNQVTWVNTHLIEPTPEQRSKFFAVGSDTGNLQLGFVLMTVLFFREHNRVARELAVKNPDWEDERLFETTRNILIVLLIKIVINEYINHISPYYFKLTADPTCLKNPPWYRANWIAVEFNLLYRWHSLVPQQYVMTGKEVSIHDTIYQTEMLTDNGLGRMIEDASRQAAGKIGLFNTNADLWQVEMATIKKARALSIRTYNEYRRLCQYPPVTEFNQITGDVHVQTALKELYGTVDRIEFYPGLFAEEVPARSALPGLIGRMVGIDAFSQALTNPLLAPRIYDDDATFSPSGKALIDSTCSLSDIVNRNVSGPDKYFVSMTLRNQP